MESRQLFEQWIASEPYQRNVARHSDSGAWPAQYIDYHVQLAWEAWLEAIKSHECDTPAESDSND